MTSRILIELYLWVNIKSYVDLMLLVNYISQTEWVRTYLLIWRTGNQMLYFKSDQTTFVFFHIIVSILCFILYELWMLNWLGSNLTLNRMDSQSIFIPPLGFLFNFFNFSNFFLKILTRKKHPQIKLQRLQKV